MLTIGAPAPDFSLPDQNGDIKTLGDYRGHKLVIYFYSKDMTAGCSKQAQLFGELNDKFEALGAKIIGVWREKKNYGKTVMGVVRSTFIVDENGVLVAAYENVKAADNPARMLEEIKKLA